VFRWAGLTGNQVFERVPFQQLHRNERLPIVLIDFVNGANVWVIKSGCGAGLALKPLQRQRAFGQVFGKKLQSDVASELGVFGFVHHAHAAATKFLKDPVVRDGLPDHAGFSAGRPTFVAQYTPDGSWRPFLGRVL
jgi:hypothetical protein